MDDNSNSNLAEPLNQVATNNTFNIPQENIQSTNSSNKKRALIIIFFISIALILILTTIFYYFYTSQNNKTLEVKKVTKAQEAKIDTLDSQPVIKNNSTPGHFISPYIKGLEFTYDSKIWEIKDCDSSMKDTHNNLLCLTGIMLKNLNTNDLIIFYYHFDIALGGGVSSFSENDLSILDDTWTRLKSKNSTWNNKPLYAYGLKQAIILFNENQKEKDLILSTCERILSDTEQGQTFYTKEECKEVKQGNIIGNLESPKYNWSFRPKLNVDIEKLPWMNKDEIEKLNTQESNTERIIVEIKYYGATPIDADEIVKQLVVN